MKRRFLIIALCLACTASFAQKRKTTTRKPVKRTTAASSKTKKVVTPSTVTDAGRSAQQAVLDTGKKAPLKPFDRPLDGYYRKTNILSARVTPYANLREADVTFAKRVWREIDLREKMNQYMGSPKQRLIDILLTAIDAGELTAYDPTATKDDPGGDGFSRPMTAGQARAKMADSAMVDKFDKDGNKTGSEIRAGEFNADSVVKFRIKEDWIFDKQRSIFEPRIIGIAPLIKPKAAGLDLDYQPAFWIYFPEARQVLATKEAVSRNNDATGLSFDDVFMKRIFSSYIVKQSNDKDERIRDYAQGIDKLYESEKVKKALLDYEFNLWKYGQ
ncbi:type IX secretion system ring subunit PorN/GldN [Mucilaginibacter glaciei]|uniref:Gliding motility protein GldN n=1 Tax=Mucilaginibacter glaciei TaxID=2772109 RepID=A0A926P0L4_9SPHI|nr:gliding motility protein GldN [Mucilaginibacter glaciei]MBD1395458.1 gliding motility protein GldN [Mucilaginibacter glaciei]